MFDVMLMTHFLKKWLIFLDVPYIFLYFILFTACVDQPANLTDANDQFPDLYTEDNDGVIDLYLTKDQGHFDLTMIDNEIMSEDQHINFPSDLQISDQDQIINDLFIDPEFDMQIQSPRFQIARAEYLSAITQSDLDQDGLDDGWERIIDDLNHFDPLQRDSDADGVIDGLDDDDGDGLNNQQESYLSTLALDLRPVIENTPPHPLAKDLILEVDMMMGKNLSTIAYDFLLDIYQSHPFDQIDGVRLHFYEDEILIPVLFTGSFEQRNQILRDHPPLQFPVEFPINQLIHVLIGTKRLDDDGRAGEVVSDANDIEGSGLMIYYDLLNEIHPRCGIDTPPPVPFILFDEAIAGTFGHELGHILQLGHDTDINGINPWNLMSVTQGCASSRQRFHGEGNLDPLLGSIETEGKSRFSQVAFELIRFDLILSVNTAVIMNQGLGIEH